jgi:uncharacterized protein
MVALLVLVALAVIFGPQLWARHVLAQHGDERPDLPGTGAELARHLLAGAHLTGYGVERADAGIGDHFDPDRRMVVLSPTHHDRRSLSAAVVAAHEVGHALQHYLDYRPLLIRQRLVRVAGTAERVASFILIAIPLVTLLTRAPGAAAALLLLAIGVMAVPILVHLITLPVEFDASFRRALPILELGYLDQSDLPHARRILTACALTYVASALARLLNFARWLRVLRR